MKPGNNPVFVYGILKGRLGSKVGHVRDYRLIDMGWFPAAIPADEEHAVRGELIYVDDATIQEFDRIEGAPNFYDRQEVEVVTADGFITAEMYVVNSDFHDAPSLKTDALDIEDGAGDSGKWYEYNSGHLS